MHPGTQNSKIGARVTCLLGSSPNIKLEPENLVESFLLFHSSCLFLKTNVMPQTNIIEPQSDPSSSPFTKWTRVAHCASERHSASPPPGGEDDLLGHPEAEQRSGVQEGPWSHCTTVGRRLSSRR